MSDPEHAEEMLLSELQRAIERVRHETDLTFYQIVGGLEDVKRMLWAEAYEPEEDETEEPEDNEQ